MASIIRFLGGSPDWTLSRLADVDPALSGIPAKQFLVRESSLHQYFQRVQNLTLPITVLRCDYSKKSHSSYLFTIFHRLNTGAMKLNNQEIRNCIYSGPFNNLLKELNGNQQWMKLNRMKRDTGQRFTKVELILRLFAFNHRYETYGGRLAKFLNDYMADEKDCAQDQLEEKRQLFIRTVSIVYERVYNETGPSRIPISIIEATLVGVARNINAIGNLSAKEIKKRHDKMLQHEEFSEQRLSEGLAGKLRLTARIGAAIDAFAGK
jgi:hypothetical protein